MDMSTPGAVLRKMRPEPPFDRASLTRLAPFFIFALTFAAFFPVLTSRFFEFEWPGVQEHMGLGWSHLRWMFTPRPGWLYMPLNWLSLALDYELWGTDPRGYHLTSLWIHSLNAVFFYFVSFRLLKAARAIPDRDIVLAAAISAALFALHPLRVEPIASPPLRRDLLSSSFYLLTILAYLRAVGTSSGSVPWRRFGWALTFYLSALLSKASVITLPAALLLLDVYPLRRGPRGSPWFSRHGLALAKEKIPFAALAAAGALLPAIMLRDTWLTPTLAEITWDFRLAAASYGIVFYLWKTMMPWGLVPYHPMPNAHLPPDRFYAAGIVSVAAISTVFFVKRRVWPAGLAAWLFYLLTLAPMLNLFVFLGQPVADRYSYLACLGWAILAAVLLMKSPARLKLAASALIIGASSLLTWRQTLVWHDKKSLLDYTLERYAHDWSARLHLARLALAMGETEAAAGYFSRLLSEPPGAPAARANAHAGLGDALLGLGKPAQALQEYAAAAKMNPELSGPHGRMASILASQGKWNEAASNYREELRINPKSSAAKSGFENAIKHVENVD